MTNIRKILSIVIFALTAHYAQMSRSQDGLAEEWRTVMPDEMRRPIMLRVKVKK